jgi:hypothetical protein
MTVSSSTNRASYSGNGTLTTFAYNFKVFDQDDLTVILRASNGTETVQTITTDYTVTGVGDVGGGNVVFGTAPASGVTVVILREMDLEQGLDLVPNDPFPAQSLENSLDKLTFMVQQHSEELGRTIKASRTNVISGSEFTISASDRANKIFAFDGSGDVNITQEIGTFRGDWATATAYEVRDIVKDTSTNNIFLVNAAHTSSGAQPLTTNANSAKYDLIVDAASATTSAAAAASSATDAETAQTAAETAQTAAETAQAAAETAETNAETAETNAETAQAAAEAAQAAAELVYDNFDDRYLGAKSTSGGDPTLDNDGDALIDGALFFDTTNNVMKVYNLGTTTWLRTTPTSAEQANINALADAAVIADMAILGTADVVNDMNILATADVVADMNVLATADVVTDMNVLGTADVVNDMNVLGTAANVTAMGLLGTSAVVTDMSILGTADVVNDMNVLGTSANVTAMNVLGTADNVTAMSNVSGSIANVNTVATNIASVNSFGETYRIAASDPTTSLDEGDLVFNTADNKMKVYNGSAWQDVAPVATSITVSQISDLTATAAEINYNDITTLGTVEASKVVTADANGDVTFPDGEILKLGNSSDLQIFATSGNSYISETGTGSLSIRAADLLLRSPTDENYLDASNNGAVRVYYDNSVKIATTSVGADVSGELIADSYNETYAAVTSSSNATTVNCENANSFSHTLTENTTFTFSNPPASGTSYTFSIEIIQDASASGYAVTWPASVDWPAATAPTLTATASAKDIFVFTTRDGGTNWYGFTAGQALA